MKNSNQRSEEWRSAVAVSNQQEKEVAIGRSLLQEEPSAVGFRQKEVAIGRSLLQSAVWMVLICLSLDSRFFVLVGFNNGGEAFLTEFCGEDAVDFCGDHAAFLICLHRRWVFNETFSDDVGMDVFCGGFNESRLGVDGLADDVIPFDSKFCRQIFKCFSLAFSARSWRAFCTSEF